MIGNRIDTRIFIPHPPKAVWAVLVDIDCYPKWNPFIRQISGQLREGENITISLSIGEDRKLQRFHPKVLRCEREKELRWLGHVLIPNILFTGEHYFILAPHEGGTKLIHGEMFRGLIVPLIGIAQFVEKFEAMNAALGSEVARRTL